MLDVRLRRNQARRASGAISKREMAEVAARMCWVCQGLPVGSKTMGGAMGWRGSRRLPRA